MPYDIEITVWERRDPETKEMKHNHIEYGWNDYHQPVSISQIQKNKWKGAEWQKYDAMLINFKVILEEKETVFKGFHTCGESRDNCELCKQGIK